jgi:hypothetical protein
MEVIGQPQPLAKQEVATSLALQIESLTFATVFTDRPRIFRIAFNIWY